MARTDTKTIHTHKPNRPKACAGVIYSRMFKYTTTHCMFNREQYLGLVPHKAVHKHIRIKPRTTRN